MVKKQPELTPPEWAIMRVVWERKEVIVRDVYEALVDREGWAQTTVRTMMERLAKKGMLKYKKIGPVYLYQPAIARQHVIRRAVRDLISRTKGEGLLDMVAYAVEESGISEQELKQLEQIIQNRKGKKS